MTATTDFSATTTVGVVVVDDGMTEEFMKASDDIIAGLRTKPVARASSMSSTASGSGVGGGGTSPAMSRRRSPRMSLRSLVRGSKSASSSPSASPSLQRAEFASSGSSLTDTVREEQTSVGEDCSDDEDEGMCNTGDI